MKRTSQYWQNYRRVRSSVDQHLSNIYSHAEPDSDILRQSPLSGNPFDVNDTHDVEEACNSHNIHSDTNISQGDGDESSLRTFTSENETESDDGGPFDGFVSDEAELDNLFSISSDSSSDLGEDEVSLQDDLCSWVSQFNIPHNAVRPLLAILRIYHPTLPQDPRTLLKTKTNYEIMEVGGGSYYHFGIEATVLSEIQSNWPGYIENIQGVQIQLNIDGLPLFKSAGTQFWPILGRIIHPYVSNPFVIGLFLGSKKPSNIHEFFQSFIDEMTLLTDTGLRIQDTDNTIQIGISCVICDTPARAFVKQTKGHSGYYGCDKCVQKGHYRDHKVTFPETNAALRTDVQFDEMASEDHHIGSSP